MFDVARIADHLEVRYAVGSEIYDSFSGVTEHPEAHEVIFADGAKHAHARRWTFRQSRRSTVTADTRRALIVAEALHPSAVADVSAAIGALGQGLAALWGVPPRQAILSATAPRFEL